MIYERSTIPVRSRLKVSITKVSGEAHSLRVRFNARYSWIYGCGLDVNCGPPRTGWVPDRVGKMDPCPTL